jgi:hypothetical protein
LVISVGANATEAGVVYATLVDVLRQGLFRLTQAVTGIQAGLQTHAFFDQLLLAGLAGEVALGEGDGFLAGITIHRYQIAGVTGQHEVLYLTLTSFADPDHFRDATKMIANVVTR